MQNSADINQEWQQAVAYPICEVCIIFFKRKIILKKIIYSFPLNDVKKYS